MNVGVEHALSPGRKVVLNILTMETGGFNICPKLLQLAFEQHICGC